MYSRLRYAAARAFAGSAGWPSFRGVLALMLLVRLLNSFGLHLSGSLFSVFTIENMHVPFGETAVIYAFHGVVGTIMALLTSWSIDRLPMLPLIFGACVLGAAWRFILAGLWASMDRFVQLLLLCVALPVTDMFFRAPLLIALKRVLAMEYAGNSELEERRRDLFVAMFYTLHNVGDIIANYIYYRLRLGPRDPSLANVTVVTMSATVLLVTAAVLAIVRRIAPHADRPSIDTARKSVLSQTFSSSDFRRFAATTLILTFVTSTFQHFDLTLTKQLLVELGPRNPFPLLQNINPVVITVLTPVMPLLLGYLELETYDVLIIGTSFSALGCLLVGLLTFSAMVSVETALAIGLFFFSVGESIWAPRLISFGLKAPMGFDAVYQALAGLPNLLLVFLSPVVSSLLIAHFCSEHHCDGGAIWSLIGLIAAVSPIGLAVASRWLRPPLADTDTPAKRSRDILRL